MANELATEYEIHWSDTAKRKVKNLGKGDKKQVFGILSEFLAGGYPAIDSLTYNGVKVRNKPSWDVDKNDPEFLKKVTFAKNNNLWHIHAGFHGGYSVSPKGDLVSQFVMHYQRQDDNIFRFADLTPHPPFSLPSESDLT
ncbi:hypothetical protein [Aliivibrio sp. A6]|uniref:hypothetical protein n=1 Tax=Aliivibrio sp. A6 TaxID=3028427 RepID=UPI0023788F6C|nr:hypothetical protein [Aliivibrio sp. A6]MDD9177456.1 hypothetical protein [Aliivibrio sp. A6]